MIYSTFKKKRNENVEPPPKRGKRESRHEGHDIWNGGGGGGGRKGSKAMKGKEGERRKDVAQRKVKRKESNKESFHFL